MPNQYTITIYNDSNSFEAFDLFQTPPTTGSTPTSEVFTNVYQAGPNLPPNENAKVEFKITEQFFAVTGTAPAPLNPNVTVNGTASEAVTLGTDKVPGDILYLTTQDGSPFFDDSKKTTGAPDGAFGIITDGSFVYPNENNIFLGLGCSDPIDPKAGVPTASVAALPSTTNSIWPVLKFYICSGTMTVGEIIDVQTVGQKLEVDFTTGEPDRVYTYNANGQFVPGPPQKVKE